MHFLFCSSASFLQRLVRVFFGCLAAVGCGMLYAVYLSTYHDRKFWFSTRQVGDFCFLISASITFQLHCHSISVSNIHFVAHVVSQELEREITFQEGSGLYYYYYKHMLAAPSFERGTGILFCCSLKKENWIIY